MCVLLCANSNVCEWLEIPLAWSYREALELCPVLSSSDALKVLQQSNSPQTVTISNVELDEAAQRRVMERSAWLQAYWRYHVRRAQHGKYLGEFDVGSDSSHEWQKPFEAIAKTWRRLLSLVGLRRRC
jgi:hypothetical protein